MSIGEKIREIRNEKGLTMQEVARRMGVTYQNISQYERDLRQPKMSTLRKIADALGVDVWEIIGFNDVDIDDQPAAEPRPLPSNVHTLDQLQRQRVPLIGKVAAGQPIYAPEDLDVYVSSPVACDAAIEVQGDSMIPGYQDGDMVYIRCRPDVEDGQVAVVFLDDEAVIKRVYHDPDGLTLLSDNPQYAPIRAKADDYASLRVFGVPVGFTRMYRKSIEGKIRKGFQK